MKNLLGFPLFSQNIGNCLFITNLRKTEILDLHRTARHLLSVDHPLRDRLAFVTKLLFQEPEDLRRMTIASSRKILFKTQIEHPVYERIDQTDSCQKIPHGHHSISLHFIKNLTLSLDKHKETVNFL